MAPSLRSATAPCATCRTSSSPWWRRTSSCCATSRCGRPGSWNGCRRPRPAPARSRAELEGDGRGHVRPVDDLEDLGPVVGEVPGHAKHSELHERSKPSTRARGRPPEPDRHEFHDGPFPSDAAREVHLNRRRHEREVLALRRVADAAEDRPQPLDSRHATPMRRSEEHTSELQSQSNLVCRLLLEKKKKKRERIDLTVTHTNNITSTRTPSYAQ